MPYATTGQISQSPIEGGIEISNQQYAEALEGMLSGKLVSVEDGVLSLLLPEEPPPVPEPEPPDPIDPLTRELPRREFRRALLHNGMVTAAVEAVIGAIADPIEREEMSIWWQDTLMFQRHHPILVDMVAAAGLTEAQGDAIWIYGVGLLLDGGGP